MNMSDIYYEFPELMTPEEKEDDDFSEYVEKHADKKLFHPSLLLLLSSNF